MLKRQRRKRTKRRALRATVVGAAWYTPAQWTLVRALATDPEVLEASYPAWQTMAERALTEVAATGVPVEKVMVEAEELRLWCALRHRPVDSQARAEFAAEQLRLTHESPDTGRELAAR